MPIILRNNTRVTVGDPEVTAVARDAAGKAIGSGDSQGFHPAVMKPGEAALGFVYFQVGSNLASGTTFDFTVQAPAADKSAHSYGHTDLKVAEANLVGQEVVGTATNTTGKMVSGPYQVDVFCFDASGGLLSEMGGFAKPDGDAVPAETKSFQTDLYSQSCPTFLAGASAYYK